MGIREVYEQISDWNDTVEQILEVRADETMIAKHMVMLDCLALIEEECPEVLEDEE